MSKPLRISLYVVASIAGIAIVVVGLFVINRIAHADGVLNGIAVATADLSGLSDDEARAALQTLEDEMASVALSVRVQDMVFQLDPAAIGFDLDEESALVAARQLGREGSIFDQFKWWLDHRAAVEVLPISGSINEGALAKLIDVYEDAALDTPPFEGAIVLEGTTPVAQYPTPGLGINRITAGPRVADALLQDPRPEVRLDIVEIPPVLPVSEVDAALKVARILLDGPIELTRSDPDATVILSEEQLALALVTRVERNPIPRMLVSFDPAVIDALLVPVRSQFEAPPKDAELTIDDEDQVVIIESRPGALIDAELAAAAAETAARTGTRTAELPFQDGAPPNITSDDIAELGIVGLISEFTTFHSCCQLRVTNIHLFADIVDGAIVMPGETFSLNEHVGQRTTERGFQAAGTIVRGKLEDTVGGGVSQFATTFYNAVFYAGVEDVTHQPHSYYFSRYPEGIEATINWPEPNLIFRNDTDAAILIKTEYTDESITVKFFGDNGGRIVEWERSGRFSYTDFETEYIPNPERLPSEGEFVEVRGARGWSVSVTQTITYPDGRKPKVTKWGIRYRAQPREVEVHPCLIPEEAENYTGEECPVEETTSTTGAGDGG